MNLKLAKSNFPGSALIRNLQIIRDSIEIALTSKKRDTAESRMNTLILIEPSPSKQHTVY